MFIHSVKTVNGIASAQVTFVMKLISNAEVDVMSVKHSLFRGRDGGIEPTRLRRRDSTTAATAGSGNRFIGVIHVDVFIGTDKIATDIAVFLFGTLNFDDSVNGPKLSVILLLKREITTVATRKTNPLSDMGALDTWWVFGSFGLHTNASQLLKGPTQVFSVPYIPWGHIVISDDAGFAATFKLPF